MQAGIEAKAGEPWYEDAMEALRAEQAGEWGSDEELGAIALRELPFYFARFGERERRHLELLEGEIPCGDALKLFNDEIVSTFDLRPELPRITAPTLVITGEDDFITRAGLRARARRGHRRRRARAARPTAGTSSSSSSRSSSRQSSATSSASLHRRLRSLR